MNIKQKKTDMGSAEKETGGKGGLVIPKGKEEGSLDETEQCKSADKRVISKSSEVQKMPVTQKVAKYRAHKNGVSAESLVKLSFGDDKKLIKATLIEEGRAETKSVTQASLDSGTVQKGQMSMGMLRSKFGGSNIYGQANSLQNPINLSPKGIQR